MGKLGEVMSERVLGEWKMEFKVGREGSKVVKGERDSENLVGSADRGSQ